MRLSSIEAAEINDEFIAVAGDCEHLCPQFHPALQSGSNAVLHRMRRRYRVERFLETLERMRERLGDPAFTTDVIVGFPGETRADFEDTLHACRSARFMKIHVFPFSARAGTPAASFPDQVDESVRKRRCHELAGLERELAQEFYRSRIGSRLQVLVEKESETHPGRVHGTDRYYIPVELSGSKGDIGCFVDVIGEASSSECLTASRVEVQCAAE